MASCCGEKIKSLLTGDARDVRVLYFENIDSTNVFCKELSKQNTSSEICAVIANGQTKGKGTRGRSFISEGGKGLYMSILFYPDPSVRASDITTFAAVKVCEAIETLTPLRPKIKWVNDVYVSEMKLSGILTEGEMVDGRLRYAIVGIGINTHGYTLPDEISQIATSIERECGLNIDREELAALIISSFVNSICKIGTKTVMDEYRARSFIIGRDLTVNCGDRQFLARALGISDSGELIVRTENGEVLELSSADVSLKLS